MLCIGFEYCKGRGHECCVSGLNIVRDGEQHKCCVSGLNSLKRGDNTIVHWV